MALPLNAYLGIAIFAGALLLAGLISCWAGARNSTLYFALPGIRRIDAKMSRRGARVFCLAVGLAIAGLGLILLLVALRPFYPTRRLRMITPPQNLTNTIGPPSGSRTAKSHEGKPGE